MSVVVKKFGGSSLADISAIRRVAERVIQAVKQGQQVIVVLSAMYGETDRLIGMVNSISEQPSTRELDALLSTGEQVSVALLSICLCDMGYPSISLNAAQVGIHTDNYHQRARIQHIDTQRINTLLSDQKIVVVTGFQGINEHGDTTTLERGGSDTTAVALAALFQADECRIYTDVLGVYTADPRIEPNAALLSHITYEEMLELSSLGAKVLQVRAVELAAQNGVPLRVLSSFERGADLGTLITNDTSLVEKALITSITYNSRQARISVVDFPNDIMTSSKVFSTISAHGIQLDMIAQSVSADNLTTTISFTLQREDYNVARTILSDLIDEQNAGMIVGCDWVAKVSIVGVGMRSHAGVATTLYKTLGEEGIAIEMVTTSEIKLSVIIDEKYVELAVRALHKAFHLVKVEKRAKTTA